MSGLPGRRLPPGSGHALRYRALLDPKPRRHPLAPPPAAGLARGGDCHGACQRRAPGACGVRWPPDSQPSGGDCGRLDGGGGTHVASLWHHRRGHPGSIQLLAGAGLRGDAPSQQRRGARECGGDAAWPLRAAWRLQASRAVAGHVLEAGARQPCLRLWPLRGCGGGLHVQGRAGDAAQGHAGGRAAGLQPRGAGRNRGDPRALGCPLHPRHLGDAPVRADDPLPCGESAVLGGHDGRGGPEL
mmetsp:Transcript_58112/g.180534  ORF Transcript_58112/g.180534 Transcript_58112/m.180534 type:complete len:243 (+) Transcript_58112:57-785(+)